MTPLERAARVLIVHMDTFQLSFNQKFPNPPATAKWSDYSKAEQSAARIAAKAVADAILSEEEKQG